MKYVDVKITQKMIAASEAVESKIRVNRTRASRVDALAGAIGELCFAEWFLGNWRWHDLTGTKGRADFLDRIEVKTSAFPFRDTLNLLVREDYAQKRQPECYVQTIIDTPDRFAKTIEPGWICRLSGWTDSKAVDSAPLRDFGSKIGGRGGYRCRYIQIRNLRPMNEFPISRPAIAPITPPN
ncbi:MAG: hypothetical protein ABJN69_14465 [Hellea sp.]